MRSLKSRKIIGSALKRKGQPDFVPMAKIIVEDNSVELTTKISSPKSVKNRLTDVDILKMVKDSLPPRLQAYNDSDAREPGEEESGRDAGCPACTIGRNEYFRDSAPNAAIELETKIRQASPSKPLTSPSAFASPSATQTSESSSKKSTSMLATSKTTGKDKIRIRQPDGPLKESSKEHRMNVSKKGIVETSFSLETAELTENGSSEVGENGFLSWFNVPTSLEEFIGIPTDSSETYASESTFPRSTKAQEPYSNDEDDTVYKPRKRLVCKYKTEGLKTKNMPPFSSPTAPSEKLLQSRPRQSQNSSQSNTKESHPKQSTTKQSKPSQKQPQLKATEKRLMHSRSIKPTSPKSSTQAKKPVKKGTKKVTQPTAAAATALRKQSQPKKIEKKSIQSKASQKQPQPKVTEKRVIHSRSTKPTSPKSLTQAKMPVKKDTKKVAQPTAAAATALRTQPQPKKIEKKSIQSKTTKDPSSKSLSPPKKSVGKSKRSNSMPPASSKKKSQSKTPEKKFKHSDSMPTVLPKKQSKSKTSEKRQTQLQSVQPKFSKSKLKEPPKETEVKFNVLALKSKPQTVKPKVDPKTHSNRKIGEDPKEKKQGELSKKAKEELQEGQGKAKHSYDFAVLHDKLFDLLFEEQCELKNPTSSQVSDNPDTVTVTESTQTTNKEVEKESVATTLVTSDTNSTKRSIIKNRRSLKKFIRSQKKPKKHKKRITRETKVAETSNQTDQPSRKSDKNVIQKSVSVKAIRSEIMDLINPKCNLQKDKGKGSPLGTELSATGRDGSLEKLKEKLDILTDVEKKGLRGASMKRNSAVVMSLPPEKDDKATSKVAETRSTIDVKMGFLGMKYGILLHWDCSGMTEEAGNWKPSVILIVLRKMCDKNFLHGAIQTSAMSTISSNGNVSNGTENKKTGKVVTLQKTTEGTQIHDASASSGLAVKLGIYPRDRLELAKQDNVEENNTTKGQGSTPTKSQLTNHCDEGSEIKSAWNACTKTYSTKRSGKRPLPFSRFTPFNKQNASLKTNEPAMKPRILGDSPVENKSNPIVTCDDESEVNSTWMSTTGSYRALPLNKWKGRESISKRPVLRVVEDEPIATTDDASGINPSWAGAAPPPNSRLASRLISNNKTSRPMRKQRSSRVISRRKESLLSSSSNTRQT